MFNTFVRANVVEFSLNNYVNFLKRFTVPDDDEPNIWSINDYPLLVLTLKTVKK